MEEQKMKELKRITKEFVMYQYSCRFNASYRQVAHTLVGHRRADREIGKLNREVKEFIDKLDKVKPF